MRNRIGDLSYLKPKKIDDYVPEEIEEEYEEYEYEYSSGVDEFMETFLLHITMVMVLPSCLIVLGFVGYMMFKELTGG